MERQDTADIIASMLVSRYTLTATALVVGVVAGVRWLSEGAPNKVNVAQQGPAK